MHSQKFTVILWPQDEGSYQVVFPHYPNCITYGYSIKEALANAKEAIELLLEGESDQVLPYVLAPHIVVSEVSVEVPDRLAEELKSTESASVPAD